MYCILSIESSIVIGTSQLIKVEMGYATYRKSRVTLGRYVKKLPRIKTHSEFGITDANLRISLLI